MFPLLIPITNVARYMFIVLYTENVLKNDLKAEGKYKRSLKIPLTFIVNYTSVVMK